MIKEHECSSFCFLGAGVFVGLARQQNAEELSAAAGLPPRDPPQDGLDSSEEDPREQWRRRVYPAGRIMHLVPLHLVPGEASRDLILCCQHKFMMACLLRHSNFWLRDGNGHQ